MCQIYDFKGLYKGSWDRIFPPWRNPTLQVQNILVYSIHVKTKRASPAVNVNFFQALQVSRPDTWAHIQVPSMQCVCARVQTNTTHTD